MGNLARLVLLYLLVVIVRQLHRTQTSHLKQHRKDLLQALILELKPVTDLWGIEKGLCTG